MMEPKMINVETAFSQVKQDILSRSYEFTVEKEGIKWSIGYSWFYREFLIPVSDSPKYIELCNLVTFMYHATDIAQSRYRKEVK